MGLDTSAWSILNWLVILQRSSQMNVEFSNQVSEFFELISLVLGWAIVVLGFLLLKRLRFKFQEFGLKLYMIGACLFVLSELIATFQFFFYDQAIVPQGALEIVSGITTSALLSILAVSFYFLAQTNQLELDALKVKLDTDKLTGLFTTKYILETGKQMLERSVQSNTVFSLMRISIDGLTSYSETFGKEQRKLALQAVAKVLSGCARKTDVLARYGEDEFLMILYADKIQAAAISKRICNAVFEQCGPNKNAQLKQNLTISIGVITRQNESDLDDMIEKAEKAMSQPQVDEKSFMAESLCAQ